MFAHAVKEVARKEFLQHFRTKRLFVVGALLATTMVLATVVAPKIFYDEQRANEPDFSYNEDGEQEPYSPDYSEYEPNQVMLLYLGAPILGGYMFIQLVAIILTSDSVCSEWQNRTIFILLSKPVPRSAFLLGKYLGTVGALSAVIAAVVAGDYVAMTLLLPEGNPGDAWAFVGAATILILGAASFAAFSLWTSTITRSTIMSTLAGLGAWLLVFPLVGSIGYFMAVTDEDFRTAGEYDHEGAFELCGSGPHSIEVGGGPGANYDEELAAHQACVEPFENAHRQYYLDRGMTAWFDWREEWEVCQQLDQEYRESEPDFSNSTSDEIDEWHNANPALACRQDMQTRERIFYDEQQRILVAKYDSPRVDWSRYLSPASTMTIADDVLRNDRQENPYDEIGLSPQTIFAGADSTPANAVAGLFALVAFAAAFIGLAILTVKRRDFE